MRYWVKIVLLNLLVIFIAGILFECVIENKLFQRHDQEEWVIYTSGGRRIGNSKGEMKVIYHPQLGYVNSPDQRIGNLYINSRGFRGKEIREQKGAFRRIVVVGGSAVFGYRVADDRNTFEFKLEEQLRDTEVINTGVIGWQSQQELVFLLTQGLDLKPDLIVVYNAPIEGWGGAAWGSITGADEIEHNLEDVGGLIYASFPDRCAHLYKVIFAKSIYYLKTRLPNSTSKYHWRAADHVDRYCQNMLKMSQLAKIYNIKFMCFLQPGKKVMYGSWNTDLFRRAKDFFVEHDIRFVDLNEYKKVIKSEYFADEAHLDERGQQAVADIMKEFVNAY